MLVKFNWDIEGVRLNCPVLDFVRFRSIELLGFVEDLTGVTSVTDFCFFGVSGELSIFGIGFKHRFLSAYFRNRAVSKMPLVVLY